ncbi:pyocin knob domain-containing protein [Rossellomorea marisflavi]|uniref:pyocin knob domain-containing protein n=1 Tax=Rossellomorea marisflavi TaxID=189381 RepID=UPI00345C6449
MSFYFPNVDPIYLFKRAGTTNDPFINLSEDITVKYQKVTLKEIPNYTSKVKVKLPNGSYLSEVVTDTIGANQFRVDYSSGMVYFGSDSNNKKLTFEYMGMGQVNIGANRIIVNTSETNQEEFSLQDVIDEQGEVTSQVLKSQQDALAIKNLVEGNQVVKNVAFDQYKQENLQSLNKSNSRIDEREIKNRIFKKKIYKSLPLKFPDYDSIVSGEDATYLLTQSFTIDWDAKELYLLYEPGGGTSTKRWVVVYNLDTNTYKSCFHAGNSGGEGIVVKKENGIRYMYVKSQDNKLGKYNLTTLPANKASITPIKEYDVGLAFDFSYLNGKWLVEQGNAAYGTYHRRTAFGLYNDSFQKIGSMDVSPEIGGYFNSSYQAYIPKRQGIAMGEKFIYQATGGNQRMDQAPQPFGYQGLKIMDYSGALLQEGVVDPFLMADKLRTLGYFVDRIESEGIHLSPSNDLYTLTVHVTDLNNTKSNTEGIIIFKELCGDEDGAIDFSSMSRNYFKINSSYIENGSFPKHSNRQMYDPYTGNVLDTFDKILDFMAGVELRKLSFFSNEVIVSDIKGAPIPSNTYVNIQNANNFTFVVDFYGRTTSNEFVIYGNSGARTQVLSRSEGVQNHKLTEDNGRAIYKYDESFDGHKTTGFYYKKSTDHNNPINQYGFLDVKSSELTCIQVYYPLISKNFYWRSFYDGNWSNWITVSGT